MAQKAVWGLMSLVALSALTFIFATVGGVKGWFDPGPAGALAMGSLIAIFALTGVLLCALPFYEGR
jgi:hypothetical protein